MHATRSTLIAVVASLATTAQAKLLIYLPLNETSGTRATDYSGSNLHGTYVNGPQLQGSNGARLDGNNDYIQLPNNLLRNLGSLTASIEVNIREEQTGLYFIFGIGSTASSSGAGNGYILATGDPEYRVAVSPSNWESEAEVRTTSALPRNQWKTVTFTVQTAAQLLGLYDDGVYIGGQTNTAAITAPGLITRGNTANNYIGRSVYTQDKYLAGSVRNFRLYDNALSAPEIAKLHRPGFQQDEPLPGGGGGGGGGGGDAPEDRIVAALGSIDIPNIDNIRGNINLPVASGGLAIRLESSDTNVITANGQVTRPVGGMSS